jgi:hypothetical protein
VFGQLHVDIPCASPILHKSLSGYLPECSKPCCSSDPLGCWGPVYGVLGPSVWAIACAPPNVYNLLRRRLSVATNLLLPV